MPIGKGKHILMCAHGTQVSISGPRAKGTWRGNIWEADIGRCNDTEIMRAGCVTFILHQMAIVLQQMGWIIVYAEGKPDNYMWIFPNPAYQT